MDRKDEANGAAADGQGTEPSESLALNALIQERVLLWSHHMRALKFDIEFRACEDEKRRVAKELHDETLPSLARLIRSIASSEATRHLLDELHATVAAFRDLLAELHPVDLDELGLVAALSNMCRRYRRFTGCSIEFEERTERCELSCHQQLCIFRAVQTALRIFSQTDNDALIIGYEWENDRALVSMRCVDKSFNCGDWLGDSDEYHGFESWCRMAGAAVELSCPGGADVLVSVEASRDSTGAGTSSVGQTTRERLDELDSIIALAKEEWNQVFNRDCALFKRLAVDVERRRISSEINSLVMPHFESIAGLARNLPGRGYRQDVAGGIAAIVAGVEAVMANLHPRLLSEVGMLASLRTLVDRFRHATLIETALIYNVWPEWTDALPVETKFALYRVTQEALNNVEKHSDATRARVVITKTAREISVCIEDNGRGVSGKPSGASRGMKIIKQRLDTIGATASWSAARAFDTGTLLTIELPLSPQAVSDQDNGDCAPLRGLASLELGRTPGQL